MSIRLFIVRLIILMIKAVVSTLTMYRILEGTLRIIIIRLRFVKSGMLAQMLTLMNKEAAKKWNSVISATDGRSWSTILNFIKLDCVPMGMLV
jgi:hypothetical protein